MSQERKTEQAVRLVAAIAKRYVSPQDKHPLGGLTVEAWKRLFEVANDMVEKQHAVV